MKTPPPPPPATRPEQLPYLAPRYGWGGVAPAFTRNDQVSAHLLEVLGLGKHPEGGRVLGGRQEEGEVGLPGGREGGRGGGCYLQDDLSGFRPSHGTVGVVRCARVHAHGVVVGGGYENGALRVDDPPGELKEEVRRSGGHTGSHGDISHVSAVFLHYRDSNRVHLWSS